MNLAPRVSPHLCTSDVAKMVAFYRALGFAQVGEIYERGGRPVFARVGLGNFHLHIELRLFADWEAFRPGFAATTLWIETEFVLAVAAHLQDQGIPFSGPHGENSASLELELFDPEGYRIIFAQPIDIGEA